MKNTAWKKDYLIVIHSDYDNTWREVTIPCTFLQAIRFARAKNWRIDGETVRLVTLTEFANLREVTA